MNLQVVTIYDAGVTPASKLGLKVVDYRCQVFDASPIEAELVPAEKAGRHYWRRDGRNLALLDTDTTNCRICDISSITERTMPHQVVLCIPDANATTEIRWKGHVHCVGRGFLAGATDPDKHQRYWFYSTTHAFAQAHPRYKRVHICGGKREGCDYWEIAGDAPHSLCGCEACGGHYAAR